MAFWEFLLQQEGDCDWLALEPPDVEVLEGRYCLIAQSQNANTPIEIQVGFEDDEPQWYQLNSKPNGQPGREQVRAWGNTTDHNGLLLVLPFTYLKPGQWSVRCQVPNDEQGSQELQTLCLRVLATESNVSEPWSDLSLFAIEATYPVADVRPLLETVNAADPRLLVVEPPVTPLVAEIDSPESLDQDEADPTFIDLYSDLFVSGQLEHEDDFNPASLPSDLVLDSQNTASVQITDAIESPEYSQELIQDIDLTLDSDDPDPTFIHHYGGEWVPEPLPEKVEVLAIAPISIEPANKQPEVQWADQLGLELFDLVKNPDVFQPVPFVPQSQWLDPPRLNHRKTGDPHDPWLETIRLPVFQAKSWIEMDSTQVPIMTNSCEQASNSPSASAQLLSRLIRASQTDSSRSPSFDLVRGGRAASQKRFLSKLSDLLNSTL